MENRNGLAVGVLVTQATGRAERQAAVNPTSSLGLKLEGDTVATTRLEVFSNTLKVEKLGRFESIEAACDAAMMRTVA